MSTISDIEESKALLDIGRIDEALRGLLVCRDYSADCDTISNWAWAALFLVRIFGFGEIAKSFVQRTDYKNITLQNLRGNYESAMWYGVACTFDPEYRNIGREALEYVIENGQPCGLKLQAMCLLGEQLAEEKSTRQGGCQLLTEGLPGFAIWKGETDWDVLFAQRAWATACYRMDMENDAFLIHNDAIRTCRRELRKDHVETILVRSWAAYNAVRYGDREWGRREAIAIQKKGGESPLNDAV